jgi:hypothetical protein
MGVGICLDKLALIREQLKDQVKRNKGTNVPIPDCIWRQAGIRGVIAGNISKKRKK